ncbi:MAG TPA: lysozyme inhibitor LprI family protein [Burkholderiales bacterium]|nr:lysozyme inhibitor LprI family protein [Burkholderiales bacterium]
MARSISATLALLALVCTASGLSAAADCGLGAADSQLAACLGQELRAADRDINTVYQDLMRKLAPTDRERLRAEQRRWIKSRDSACRLESKETDRERWYQWIEKDFARTVCVSRFTRQRTAQLHQMLDATQTPASASAPSQPRDAAASTDELDYYESFPSPPREKGKYYFEVVLDRGALATLGDSTLFVGVSEHKDGQGYGTMRHVLRSEPPPKVGDKFVGEVIGIAVDLDEGTLYHHLNGVWLRGKPGSNQGGELKLGRPYHAGVISSVSLREPVAKGWIKINLGDQPFAVPVPAGYQPFSAEKGASGADGRAHALGVMPAHGTLEGKTQSQWTASYWQWLMSFPIDQGPGTDTTGERCGLKQAAPIWYLASNLKGGKAIRTCRVPRGKPILVPLLAANVTPKLPVISVDCATARRFAKMVVDGASGMRAFLDGVEIPNLTTYRETSAGCFEYTDPAGARVSPVASDGYWLFLKPLSPGRHELRYEGRLDDLVKETVYLLDVS